MITILLNEMEGAFVLKMLQEEKTRVSFKVDIVDGEQKATMVKREFEKEKDQLIEKIRLSLLGL